MAFTVGKNVDGWCTRCKLVLAHTIEVVTNGKIVRVHCNTCGGKHTHRAAAPGVAKKTGARATRESRAAKTEPKKQNDYRALLRGRTEAASRPYSTSQRFAVGELVSHAAFGVGVVTAERETTKIDVVFPDGPRVLLQGR